MGKYDFLLLAGVVAALAFGAFRVPRAVAYIVFLIVSVPPVYDAPAKYGMTLGRGALMVAIFFAILTGLYWVGGKFAGRKPT